MISFQIFIVFIHLNIVTHFDVTAQVHHYKLNVYNI